MTEVGRSRTLRCGVRAAECAGNETSYPRWFVAQVKPRRERIAITHLERQGFRVRCPLIDRIKRVRGRTTTVHEPVFPGYVFVGFKDDGQSWRSINSTIGVLRLVTFGSAPSSLPTGFVEQLEAQIEGGCHGSAGDVLRPGDEVRIIGGPFDDLCGVLTASGSQQRVTVLLALLSGHVSVHLSPTLLIAA